MALKRAIVVEDDAQIREAILAIVSDLGFSVEAVGDGVEAKARVVESEFDLVVLDLMLPGASGMDICQALRSVDTQVPIIVITAMDDEPTTVLLFEIGADDYITKPFREHELKARISRVLKRSAQQEEEGLGELIFEGLKIELDRRRVYSDDQEVQVTAREFELLTLLASSPGKPFTRDQINEHLYGYEVKGYDRSVISHVKRLRNKIEPIPAKPKYLLTARGYGYLFSDKVLC